MNRKEKTILALIIIIGILLRFVRLPFLPSGFTPDEAAQTYTAYSILKTGADEWGVVLPLNPRSFGDFKAPIYTYLTIIPVALFGLTEFSARFVNAFLSSLSIIIVFFLARQITGKATRETKLFAFFAASLLAINPWHISLSRGAFEFNLPTFFLPLAVFLFARSLSRPIWLPFSCFFFGLNLLSYHSAKIVTLPVILAGTILFSSKLRQQLRHHRVVLWVSAGLLAFSIFLMVSGFFTGSVTRPKNISIFSGYPESAVTDRFTADQQGLPDTLSRLFHNRPLALAGEFFASYFSYLSPGFLFVKGAGEATYGMLPGHGLLYLLEIINLPIAFYLTIKTKNRWLILLWLWVLVSPIPAALARGVGSHASRFAIAIPALCLLSAYGLASIVQLLITRKISQILLSTLVAGYLVSVVSFTENYFFVSPRYSSAMLYGWRDLVSLINHYPIKPVVINRTISEPQAYLMFYQQLDPQSVQRQTPAWLDYEKKSLVFVDQLPEYQLDRYQIRSIELSTDLILKDRLLVLKGNEITKEQVSKLSWQAVYYPDGQPAFYVIDL